MKVVSDASVVINLAAIEQLELLKTLFGQILIPQAVFEEVVVAGAGLSGANDVAELSWISTQKISDRVLVDNLLTELDRGEAESIVLSKEVQSDLLLIDERKGRAVADRLGIPKIGLLGVLVEAKRRRAISSLKPLLDELRNEVGFWIHEDLYEHVLQETGEAQ